MPSGLEYYTILLFTRGNCKATCRFSNDLQDGANVASLKGKPDASRGITLRNGAYVDSRI